MADQPLKNNLIMILEILRKHSDLNHRLTQKDIREYLKSEYDMSCDRKTVKRNLMNLIEFGFDIEYTEIQRGGTEENIIVTDIYYNHSFEESELKIISDSLLFSKYISARETKQLIQKVENMASPFSKNMLKNAVNYEFLGHTENVQVFYTVEILNQAIKEQKKIAFAYCEYGIDKELHPRRVELYEVNPYYTVTANGRYYLIGNVDKYNNLAHFRVDKIKDIEICETSVKPIRQLIGCENGFQLSEYMKEHIYMFVGDTVYAKLELDCSLIGQVVDWFGKNFKVVSNDDEKCVITLSVNENALFYWVMQYGEYVKVLSPKKVQTRVQNAIKAMLQKYSEE